MIKKIHCPRCSYVLTIDTQNFGEDNLLRIRCVECGKEFGIRRKFTEEPEERTSCGTIEVLASDNGVAQNFTLYEGRNTVGRYIAGNPIEASIVSDDFDMDRNHCIIEATKIGNGEWKLLLSDFGSRRGTFCRGERLGKYDKLLLEDEDVVVIGSTTFTVHIHTKQ